MIFAPQIRAGEPMKPRARPATLQKRLRNVTNCSAITTPCSAWWRNRLPPEMSSLPMNWNSPRLKPRSLALPPPKMSSRAAFIWTLRAAAFKSSKRKARVAALEEKVRDGRITAPSDGTLYSLPVRQGDFVKAGDLLAEMADLHKVRVRAFVDEPEIVRFGRMNRFASHGTRSPITSGRAKRESVPKQVVPRGLAAWVSFCAP